MNMITTVVMQLVILLITLITDKTDNIVYYLNDTINLHLFNIIKFLRNLNIINSEKIFPPVSKLTNVLSAQLYQNKNAGNLVLSDTYDKTRYNNICRPQTNQYHITTFSKQHNVGMADVGEIGFPKTTSVTFYKCPISAPLKNDGDSVKFSLHEHDFALPYDCGCLVVRDGGTRAARAGLC